MARAKRTERAEARRRYRATLATDPLAEDADGADEPSGSGSSQGTKRSNAAPAGKQGSSGTPERVGFVDAFKLSIRPVHVREDIASLPWITIHTKAIWLPVLITIGATIATAVTGANDMVTGAAVHLLRRLPGDRRGVHRRLPRTAGELARRGRGRPRVGGLLRRAGRRGPAAAAVQRAIHGQCDRRLGLGIRLLADHGRVLRRRRGLVSTLPRPVEPEPEPPPVAGPEAATRRRPDAQRAHLRRPRRKRSTRPDRPVASRAGASRRARAGAHPPADRARRPRRPPRGVPRSTGRSH